MAFKQFEIPDIGSVTIYKRRGARSLRLSVRPDGTLRVTIPPWAPYASGLSFAKSRADWIQRQQIPRTEYLRHGQPIGKAHRLAFVQDEAASKPTTRIVSNEIVVRLPVQLATVAPAVQKAARNASVRALRRQAEELLPRRLRMLADQHEFSYRSVEIKQLKSRWGSCDTHANITLNLYLMQLPWELIDYVLLHELTHTKVMQHGPVFWSAMEKVAPNVKAHRKAIRAHRPAL